MNRTGVKATIIGIIAAALLTSALAFMLWNAVPTAGMEHVEINGRIIPISGAEWDYETDSSAWKGRTADGVLVMSNGTKYDISYNLDYDLFTINDRFGMYVIREQNA